MWFVSDTETPAKKFSATFDFRPRTSFQLPILYNKEREYAKNERRGNRSRKASNLNDQHINKFLRHDIISSNKGVQRSKSSNAARDVLRS